MGQPENQRRNKRVYENENTTVQNLCNAAKEVLRRQIITIEVYLKKQKKKKKKNLKQPNLTPRHLSDYYGHNFQYYIK